VSEDLEEVKAELRKELNKLFEPYIVYGKWLVESTKKLLKFSEEVEHMFKYRLKDVTSVRDLEILGAIITRLTEQQLRLTQLQFKMMIEFKEAVFYIQYLPVYTTLKFGEKAFPLIGKRLKASEKEIEHLKKRREEIRVEIDKDIKDALKDFEKWMKRAKKAQKAYVA
jgi:hypothetical protein